MGPACSAAAHQPGNERVGLLEKLLAAVRPEFRVEVYVPDPRRPGLRPRPSARCAGCDRRARAGALQRPRTAGGAVGPPDAGGVPRRSRAAGAGPRTRWTGAPLHGCRYGTSGLGLCSRHRDRLDLRRAGPTSAAWTRRRRPRLGIQPRRVPAAVLHAVGRERQRRSFCKSHDDPVATAAAAPTSSEYVADCQLRRHRPHRPPRPAARSSKLEFQYALQCRHDEQSPHHAAARW